MSKDKTKQTETTEKELDAKKAEAEALAQIEKQLGASTPKESKEASVKETESVGQKVDTVLHVEPTKQDDALYERFDHMVKVNGVYYNAGDLVPKG